MADVQAKGEVPKSVAMRLSLYLRRLEKLKQSGRDTVSSADLGASLSLRAAQVRKDLAYFGQFGSAGVGYRIDGLIPEIRKILGTDRIWPVALVGYGNLGSALLRYAGFEQRGFRIACVFDNDAHLIGKNVDGREIHDVRRIGESVASQGIKLAMIAVPVSTAQTLADTLVAAGIRGILNFAPTSLRVPSGVHVSHVDLAIQLEQLSFLVTP